MIQLVYLFRNGMVMVMGTDGQQLEEFQGRWEEVLPRILAAAPANTTLILNSDWPPTVSLVTPA